MKTAKLMNSPQGRAGRALAGLALIAAGVFTSAPGGLVPALAAHAVGLATRHRSAGQHGVQHGGPLRDDAVPAPGVVRQRVRQAEAASQVERRLHRLMHARR
jgi:hypothetical protein